MKIAQIRDTIQQLRFSRNWVTGGTHAEFLRQNVPQSLESHIDAVRALQIPERFARERQDAAEQIEYALKVIGRWHAQRAVEGVPA